MGGVAAVGDAQPGTGEGAHDGDGLPVIAEDENAVHAGMLPAAHCTQPRPLASVGRPSSSSRSSRFGPDRLSPQSAFAPAAFATFAHLATSSLRNAPNS